jgi:hypothetical protein
MPVEKGVLPSLVEHPFLVFEKTQSYFTVHVISDSIKNLKK